MQLAEQNIAGESHQPQAHRRQGPFMNQPAEHPDMPDLGSHTIRRAVVLASASPYRKELLAGTGIDFRVLPSGFDESLQPESAPERYAQELALRKAQAVASRCQDALVIGVDTICAIGELIIGKPKDHADAEAMIQRACDAGMQRVISGIAVIDTRDMYTERAAITSLVRMRKVPKEIIRAYAKTGDPMGKCGALSIEGSHSFIDGYEGSYSNIMGLPLEWLLPVLIEMDSREPDSRAADASAPPDDQAE